MSVLYTVRCRFTEPEREDEWNDWYRGHLDVLLGVPGFLAAQRFRSGETIDDRPYLAMYEVSDPEVFTSEPYLAIWGFDEWRPLIDNWTRDISDPIGDAPLDFATPARGRLRASFASGEPDTVRAALEGLSGCGRAFVVGLDRSCSGIAWRTASQESGEPGPIDLGGLDVAEAVYTPLTDCMTSTSSKGAAAE